MTRIMVLAAFAAASAAALGGCSVPANGPAQALAPWEKYPPAEAKACPPAAFDLRLDQTNAASPGFGCAQSANLAAMAANRADLTAPRAASSPDAIRSAQVFEKWRAGDATSSNQPQGESAPSLIGGN